jgi:hypothetical protein
VASGGINKFRVKSRLFHNYETKELVSIGAFDSSYLQEKMPQNGTFFVQVREQAYKQWA